MRGEKGDDLYVEHTLNLIGALYGFQFPLTRLDKRQLPVKKIIKPGQYKAINDEVTGGVCQLPREAWRIIAIDDTHRNYNLILRTIMQLVGNFYLLKSTSWEMYGSGPLVCLNALKFDCYDDAIFTRNWEMI
jgi:hypothetical protein